jgi:hypothetical protein
VNRPTVTQAEAWRPESLRDVAEAWDRAALDLQAIVDAVLRGVRGVAGSRDVWTGSAAEAARQRAVTMEAGGAAVARALITAAVAARDGAVQIASAQADVLATLKAARAEGCVVGDDGRVSAADPPALLIALSGGDPAVAREVQALRAEDLTHRLGDALDRLGAADADAAADVEEAFASPVVRAAATVPAGTSGDSIAGQIAAMSDEQRDRLIDEFPSQVGNTDGVPWDIRARANRINIAQAILDEPRDGPDALRRIAFYQDLLREVEDPATGQRVDRQILAFDPARSVLVEFNGNLAAAKGVAVLIPGMNTTVEGSAANTATARRFVSATHGEVAAITYLGGPFPQGGNLVASLAEAADPRFALDMAPGLAAFSVDVDRTVDATGRQIPVTYIGHSYGGSILGTAEALGLTADRTLYLAAAGAGVGVDEPDDWHNRNPDVLRFSMTAPGDVIEFVQGLPGGPHGADPDEMPGVIRLATGRYDDGRPMAGPRAHTDVIDCQASDSWRTILAVITGDRERIQV